MSRFMHDYVYILVLSRHNCLRPACSCVLIHICDEHYRMVLRKSDFHELFLSSHCMLQELHCLRPNAISRHDAGPDD